MKKYLVYVDAPTRSQLPALVWVTRDNAEFLLPDPAHGSYWHPSSLAKIHGNEEVLLQTDKLDELIEYLQASGRHGTTSLADALLEML